MSARVWIGLAAGVVILVGLAGAGLWYMQGQGLYRPGAARRDLQRFTTPAGDAARPGFWAVTDRIALRHFEAGSGTDVLVVHGGPGFPPLRPWAATAYTRNVHWIFYQQRGCGESTRPFDRPPPGNLYRQMQAVEGTLGLGAQVADIERMRQLLGRDKLVLVGHSFGALIAALYAAEFPEHVQALVLVAPANLVVMPNRGPDLYQLIADRLPASMREEYAAYRKRLFDFRELFRQDERSLATMFLDFQRFYGVATAASGGAVRPVSAVPVEATTSAAALAGGTGGAAATGSPGAGATAGGTGGAATAGVSGPEVGPEGGPEVGNPAGGWVTVGLYLSLGRRHDWSEALRRVQAPVLVLHGARDLQAESQSRAFAAFFPHARVQVIPDAGHFSFDEQPQAFAAALESFLAERS